MKKIAIIIILIMATGVIGALYTQIWNPSWNPFRPIPKIVLARMALKMNGVKTFHVDGNIETENIKRTSYKYNEEENITFNRDKNSSKISLDIDRNNSESQNSHTIIETGSHSESLYGEREYSSDFSNKVEFKKIGDTLYFIVTDTSEEKKVGVGDMINNRWVKLNQEDLGDLVDLFWLDDMIDVEIPKERQEELIKELVKLFIREGLYEVKEELPDEEIEGQMTYHYSLALNERETKHLISDIILKIAEFVSESVSISESAQGQGYSDPKEALAMFSMIFVQMNMEFQSEISKFFKQMDGVDIEVWIGQRDNYLHKIQFKKKRNLVDYFEKQLYERSKEEILEAERSILVDINLSKFNDPVKIEPPEEFENLEEILKGVVKGRGENKRDSRRKSDIRQISLAMEMYYDDYSYYPAITVTNGLLAKDDYTPSYLNWPKDPGGGSHNCNDGDGNDNYCAVANNTDQSTYCVFTTLEGGGFFAASEKGTRTLDRAPVNLSECKLLFSISAASDCDTYCSDPGSWISPEGMVCICNPSD